MASKQNVLPLAAGALVAPCPKDNLSYASSTLKAPWRLGLVGLPARIALSSVQPCLCLAVGPGQVQRAITGEEVVFSKAIVRLPCQAMINGISTAGLGKPDYRKALAQHADYVRALEECGLQVSILPADEAFPDSVFIEDATLITPRCAVITNPGAPQRSGETQAMRSFIASRFEVVESIAGPGTVDGGDIMMVGDHYFIGLSARTSQQGAEQMIAILEKHGMSGSMVALSEVLHLKTGVNYLENNILLACGEFVSKPEFKQFDILEIDPEEAYAANSVWVNDTVLSPRGYPRCRRLLEAAGYEVREVDVSEFRKLDGGLSCLSLRF